jgi:hypothetical protein
VEIECRAVHCRSIHLVQDMHLVNTALISYVFWSGSGMHSFVLGQGPLLEYCEHGNKTQCFLMVIHFFSTRINERLVACEL